MCYDAAYYRKRLAKIEAHYGEISYDKAVWKPEFQLSAFSKGNIPVITPEHPHEVEMIRWGFVPSFAKTAQDQAKYHTTSVNCRADTLRVKLQEKQHSMFKPLVNSPCAILIDGFYEWHTMPEGTKIPYFISMKDGETFPVAGFTATWKDLAEPERVYTGATLCTTAANPLLGWVHNKPKGSEDLRMPAILMPGEVSLWLDNSLSADERLSIIRPYPADEMKAYSVANYKKKDFKREEVTDILPPLDYNIEGLPTQIDGSEVEKLPK